MASAEIFVKRAAAHKLGVSLIGVIRSNNYKMNDISIIIYT